MSGFSLETPAVVDVFTEVLKRGPIARIDIARRTGLSQAAVTKAVAPLLLRGLLSAHDNMRPTQPGRPVQPISVNEGAQLAIGVTVRVDEVFGVATTMRANVLHSVTRRLASTSVEAVVEAVAATVEALQRRLGDDAEKVLGVGVAVSGDVDKQHGFVRASPRLNWSTVPFEKMLRDRLGLAVIIDNDVRALSIAEEWFGIGVDAESFAIVTIGAGIGCGLYVNGDVIEGAYGVAGELGHLPLGPSDLVCSCGRHGCVETVASSSAILEAVRSAKHDPLLTMREAVQLARAADPDAVAAFERAAVIIGMALATMANLVGPSVILVAGESVTDFDLYEQRIRESFDEHTFGAAGQCQIVTRSHTFEDWARGAAASLLRASVTRT
ncbi:ROK family transcriptional regulator [Diaminobutyricibacter tongyongensis]|uniref:ROK family transcriptional regulator n=1 Tax=Leifsonia tongyongensis TaxID=1268043 RepID=A0A6L9XV88_9MICO|nr:ROK family protein [Diaminobutyricibacter tongyongensis]NEN05293.1 ROK family transcriptional regulator [Diaminobutyricibacter tongyongensis]